MKTKVFIFLLFAVSMTAVAQQKKVAVYVVGEETGISKVLGDQLVAAFAKSGKYIAVERTSSFLSELSREQYYQRTGMVSDSEIAALGVQFGVQYVCVADMSDVFGEKYISARLIDVETAEIVNTHSVSGRMASMDDCLQMATEIAGNLTKGTFAEQIKKEQEKIAREKAEQEAFRRKQAKMEENERNNPGYIDLGLPSGTLWKKYNEENKYKYKDARTTFGSQIPSEEQILELLHYCTFTKQNSSYKVEGPNGHYILLQLSGYQRGLEKIAEGKNGFYLFRGYGRNRLKIWGTGGYELDTGWDNDKYSVRLVK